MIRKNHKLAAAISLVLAGSAGSVHAQVLEELVVTAQKRSQSVQDIPIAISGLSADEIEALGFDDATDLSAQVPNVQVSGTFGKTQPIFSIRGVSQSDFNSNQASPVGIYTDEAYLPATFTHGLNFFDLERTEVLRGPQGTLYGRNTTGGAINLITRTPEIDGGTSGNINVGVGNFGLVTANGAVESTLVEGKLAARVAFTYEEDDGFFRNLLGGPNFAQTDSNGARIALNWQPSEQLNAVFKYTSAESTPRGIPARGEARIPVAPGVFVDVVGATRDPNLSNFEGEVNDQGNFDSESDLATLRLTYEGSNYSIVSVSSYNDAEFRNQADTDGQGGPFPTASQVYSGDSESFNQDIRFVSNYDGAFNFIAGVYYGIEENSAQVQSTFTNPDFNIFLLAPDAATQGLGQIFTQLGGVFQDLESTKEAVAVYGQGRWELNDKLGLDIGLRYTEDDITLDRLNVSRTDFNGTPIGSFIPGNNTGINNPFIPPGAFGPGSPGIFLDGPLTDESAAGFTETEREVTGKIGLDYKVSDDLLVYGSYNRGYRSGSINNGLQYIELANPSDNYADPEFLDAYEVGLKGDFLNGRLRVNVAAFYYEYEDQQFVNQVGLAANLENAGESEILGAEFEVLALLTENLSVKVGLGLLDTEFTELSLANTVTPDPFDEVDLSGNELISAPDVNLNLAIDYEIPTSWGVINAHVDANYQDDQFYSAYNNFTTFEAIGQEAYWLVNARLSAAFGEEGNLTVSAWVKNLAEEEYDFYAINLQALGFDFFLTGAPRTYGLEVGYKF